MRSATLRTLSWMMALAGAGGYWIGYLAGADGSLPAFGRDTVLVWKIQSQEETHDFVVRIATFTPNRFIEWENATTQGTTLMPAKAIAGAKVFVNTRLFSGGSDVKGKDATTLWLSQRLFRELKANGRVRVALDSIDSWMVLLGKSEFATLVNRSERRLPVIRVSDDRGSERWFLDLEENPLMVQHVFRHFSQKLVSITTDRPNTLRWIKGKKLNPPQ